MNISTGLLRKPNNSSNIGNIQQGTVGNAKSTTQNKQAEDILNIQRSILPLFSWPVYVAELGQPKDNVLRFCENIEYVRYKADNGWVSKNKYVLDAKELSELKSMLLRELSIYLHEALQISDEYTFYINNSWAQKISPGDWTHAHIHENSLISGVYYVQVFEDSGDFLMEKPMNAFNLFPSTLTFNFKKFNMYNSSSWSIKPKNGTFIISASHLSHSAGLNKTTNDRYCIPFNAYVKGKFGAPGGVSDLILN